MYNTFPAATNNNYTSKNNLPPIFIVNISHEHFAAVLILSLIQYFVGASVAQ